MSPTSTRIRATTLILTRALALLILFACALLPARALAAGPIAHVEKRGHGPVNLVLIPGLADDWSIWQGFMDRSAERYTMHALTIAGFGGTEAMPEPPPPPALPPEAAPGVEDTFDYNAGRTPWIDAAADSLVALIEGTKIEKPFLICHTTLGAMIGARAAARLGDRISGIVLVDALAPVLPLGPSGLVTGRERQMLVDAVAPALAAMTDADWARMVDATDLSEDPEFVAALRAMIAKTPRDTGVRFLTEMMRADISRDLLNLQAPLAGFYPAIEPDARRGAALDPVNPRAISRNMLEDVFKARVVTFYRLKRFVMHDKPRVFDDAVAAFISNEPLFDYVPRAPRAEQKGAAPAPAPDAPAPAPKPEPQAPPKQDAGDTPPAQPPR